MGAPFVQVGATILCAHGGTASILPGAARVTLSGQPAVTISDTLVIAGCPNQQPVPTPVPCLTGQWLTGATRVTIGGVPVVTQNSTSVTVPNGTPANIVSTQVRVKGI